jgi:hypothetical protein
MYIQYLGEIVLLSPHNAVGVCNQVTFLILYYPSSRLIPLLDVINTPIQVPDIVDLTVSFQFLKFRIQICLLFVPEMSASIPPYIVQLIYI